ncbi:MAG: TM2 domain-containing protein [Erythrobacter sp.]|jgi:TM2 domain-containing membrane protein YozV|nr:TM2 domain-containing protein [Erythrobacter sp.]
MRGQIMDFDLRKGTGLISGEDGTRYTFDVSEWRQNDMPKRGRKVDFEASDGAALQIYTLGPDAGAGRKDKWVAAVLAFVLGGLGAHKFYLGYTQAGIIMLAMTIGGFLTSIILIGIIPLMAAAIIAFVEFIIYLVTSEEDFEERYVLNERPWF